jgi:hypothetical protein
MTIGVLHIDLLVGGARSLKDKRRVVKSIKQQVRNKFNCSVAEVGEKDLWQRASLAICIVGDSSRFVNEQLSEVAHFVEHRPHEAQVADIRMELL